MQQKVILDVPRAQADYARQHGAEYCGATKRWHCLEPVPEPLLEYVVGRTRTRDYTRESTPSCPLCHCAMVLREGRLSKEDFWGCSRFPACRGTRRTQSTETTSIVAGQRGHADSEAPKRARTASQEALQPHVVETLLMCRRFMPYGNQWKKWLDTPKLRFGGATPKDMMLSIAGCGQVQALLKETFEPAED
ncbi:topoisomerase DNA-binding C4 zinc finger domain-containing protein [Alcaligenes sp. Marseille-Q7550]